LELLAVPIINSCGVATLDDFLIVDFQRASPKVAGAASRPSNQTSRTTSISPNNDHERLRLACLHTIAIVQPAAF